MDKESVNFLLNNIGVALMTYATFGLFWAGLYLFLDTGLTNVSRNSGSGYKFHTVAFWLYFIGLMAFYCLK